MTNTGEPIPGQVPEEAVTTVREELPSLPFTYESVDDKEKAQYREWRVSPVVFSGEENEPYSDEEIVESVKRQHEAKQWYTTEYWRKKGIPEEQIEFTANGRQITVYNFNKEKPFSDEHVARTKKALSQLASRFPQVLDNIRWVLVDDVQPPSLLADDERYPTKGTAMREHKAFRFMPRGTELMPHRIEATSNFEGTFVHELGHLMQSDFEDEWREKYQWQYCSDNKDEWEVREAPNGERRWFNKETGEMSPQCQYPLQPDQCVTTYGRQNMGEDICESLVAYIYDPEKLQEVAPDKHAILQGHDAGQAQPEVSSKRVAKDDIGLPEIKPETIFYYVEEPQEETTA